MSKHFAIPAYRLKAIAAGHGSCFATDRITLAGRHDECMYREAPAALGSVDARRGFLSPLTLRTLLLATPPQPTSDSSR